MVNTNTRTKLMMLKCLASCSLLFSFLLRAYGRGKGGRCVCAYLRTYAYAALTIILMIVAGMRQKSPGNQQRIVKMNVAAMLVAKAYLGSLVESSVGLVSVCCVAAMGT